MGGQQPAVGICFRKALLQRNLQVTIQSNLHRHDELLACAVERLRKVVDDIRL